MASQNEIFPRESLDLSWQTLSRRMGRHIPIAKGDIIAASIVINLLSLGLPLLTLQVYDRIIPNRAMESFFYLTVGLLIVILLDTLLKLARAAMAGYLGAKYEHALSLSAFKALMTSKLEASEATPAGIHLDRIAGIDVVRDFYSGSTALTFLDLPFALLFLLLIAFIGGPLAFVPLGILLLTGAAALWLGEGLRASLKDRKLWDDRRFNFVIETLSGMHTVKGLAMEQLMLRRYERLLKTTTDKGHKLVLLSSVSQAVGNFSGQLALALTAGVGALFVINGSLTIGSLAACTLLAGRTVQPVLKALTSWTRFQSVDIALNKINEIHKLESESSGGLREDTLEILSLQNASYRHTRESDDILQNINLTLTPSDMIGIRGANGSGKSTLLNMLMGRLVPTDGVFSINRRPSDDFNSDYLKEQISYVSQRSIMLQGTVLENLTLFRPDLYIDDALDFASRLGLDQIFAHLPDGYDTRVGEASASSLPRGVAQRVAIVRALVRRPKFLLLDEANASLDDEGEAYFKSMLLSLKGQVGIVMVTYRPSLLALADRRYDLDAGLLTPVPMTGGLYG